MHCYAPCAAGRLRFALAAFTLAFGACAHAQTQLVVDNIAAGLSDNLRNFSGTWCNSTTPGYYGTPSLVSCGSSTREVYRWWFRPAISADFDVYVRWISAPSRSSATRITVADATNAETTKTFNQQLNGGQWMLHGRYPFSAGVARWVQVTDGNGEASVDAIRLVAAASGPPPPPTGSQPTLSIGAINASAVNVRIYPADTAGRTDGAAALTRRYNANSRVWLSAPLRSGSNYFVKWQKNGLDFDHAATTSIVMDASQTLTAVYETPSCTGITVAPGTDSLKNALAAAAPGSTFCLLAGVHRFTQTVNARANDKFIGASGAILNGSKVVSNFVRQGSYWVATGQVQQEPPLPTHTSGGQASCESSSPACIYPERVFLAGRDLTQVRALTELAPGKFYFDYAGDRIYLADDPTGLTVEATTGSGGIIGYVNANKGSVTVKNLIFEKFGGGEVSGSAHAALKTAEGWRVENNEFRYISNAAVEAWGNPLIRNNNIHHNGQYGVIGGGTLEGNIISNNNIDGFYTNNDAGGTKFHSTRGLSLRGNTLAGNQGPALWADFDNINVIYEHNIVENNAHTGIFHEISCNATIRYNLLRGNNASAAGKSLWYGAQIYLRSSKDTQIYGNDVSASGSATHTIGVRGGDTAKTGTNCGSIELRNVTVRDNVMRMDSGDFTGIIGGDVAGYSTSRNLKFSNNTHYLSNLSGAYYRHDTVRGPMTREQWQAAGQDVTGKFLQQ